jgi:hypothetical protein
MLDLAIDQIITLANNEMQKDRDRLEVEDSGREVAALQGKIVGYKKLIGSVAAEFGLSQGSIDYLGGAPLKINDLEDATLDRLTFDIATLRDDPAWRAVLARIDVDVENMKTHLLFEAEKSRDLDLCQGQYKGETVYKTLFNLVENETKRREAEREKKRKNPELFEGEASA